MKVYHRNGIKKVSIWYQNMLTKDWRMLLYNCKQQTEQKGEGKCFVQNVEK